MTHAQGDVRVSWEVWALQTTDTGYVVSNQRRPAPFTVVLHAPASPHPPATPATVSSALARILEQLNPTAWLPAAVLVGDFAVAVAYAQATGSPATRWHEIGNVIDKKPLGIILGTLFALSLVTILTQTVGFTAIRLLEGYWGASKPAASLAALGIWRHNRRRRRLTLLGEGLDARALRTVLPLLKRKFASEPLVATAIDWRANDLDVASIDPHYLKIADDYLESKEWMRLAPARLAHRISAVDDRLNRFPAPDRMMPTQLGLALRLPEDQLEGPAREGNLRGYVIRNLSAVDPMLLSDHDEHRNRLDMYAVMSLVALTLVPINFLILKNEVAGVTLALLIVAAVMLSWSSYRGAVAAAEEYGQALKAIDRAVIDGAAR